MKITINTDVLKKYNLSFGQYMVLLTSYYNLDYGEIQQELESQGLVDKNLFKDFPPIISDNIKNLIAKIIIESDDKVLNCPIKDFDDLARKLQEVYPDGVKSGKTYTWRGTVDVIAQKLRTLVVKYDFSFTEEEAISATKEYLSSFQVPYTYMHTLRNFILYTKRTEDGKYEMESIFMTIIENNRENRSLHFGEGDIGDLEDALG
jgi:hypothetical protein